MKSKLRINIVCSVILQISMLVCGFIMPKITILVYGSSVNGLVSSIGQFLQLIAFLELGIGAVVQSALYKPLAEKNKDEINCIVSSANVFYKRIAYVLVIYTIILAIAYPLLIKSQFDFSYIVFLVLAMSCSYFFQYYFGIVDGLLLSADQRAYVQYSIQAVTLLINTGISVILMVYNCPIQVVKGVTALIYLARPFVQRIYVNKRYGVNRKQKFEKEPLEQKWNGVAQHVSAMVLGSTDIIILTAFSSLENVSIYMVYNTICTGVKQLVAATTSGANAFLGRLIAENRKEELCQEFAQLEWRIHNITVLAFGCCATLIVPFVSVYIRNVEDAEYIQKTFGVLLTLALAFYCFRLPYSIVILAHNHFRQTQGNYIVTTVINLIISVILVWKWGVIGVAIGTLIALIYQTIWMAIYVSKQLTIGTCWKRAKQFLFDIVSFFFGYVITTNMIVSVTNYIEWFFLAMKVFCMWGVVIIGMNLVVFPQNSIRIFRKDKENAV